MNINYFKKINNLFKSTLEIERKVATEHFYNSFKPDTIKTDLVDLILSYYKSGFKIEQSHSKYIGKQILMPDSLDPKKQDPFHYIWLKTVLNSEDILSNNKNLNPQDIKDTLLFMLKDMIAPSYQQYLAQKTDNVLKDFLYLCDCKNLLEYDSTDLIKKVFFDIDIMKSYFDTFNTFNIPGNLIILNKTIHSIEFIDFPLEQIQKFKHLQQHLKSITLGSAQPELDRLLDKNNNNNNVYFDTNKLSLLYSQPSASSKLEIKDNMQALSALKQSVIKLNPTEEIIKNLSLQVFNNIETLLNFPKLHNYKEPQRYLNNLLTKHLPDVFNNYLELPVNYRTSENKNNPQEVLKDILSEVDTKLSSVSEEIFQDNVTNLNIKKRFIKSI